MNIGFQIIRALVLLGLLGAFQGAVAAESVVVAADAPLLAEPRSNAKVVTQLKQGTTGEVLVRKGAWVNLQTEAGTGWVNSFNVRSATAAPAPAAKSGPAGITGPRPKTTATIGIRGLDAEDLKGASFNPQQLQMLDGFAASRQAAASAAQASGLQASRIDYLK